MTTPNTPAPTPHSQPDPSNSDGPLNKLIDRLPKEVGPGWFLLALLVLVLGVIGVTYIAGFWIAAAGGLIGLAALFAAIQKRK
ncbi:Putative membrane protein [Amycolatopsis japonica]|uniref:Putative membrane protein n=1 Tax=Amycolatopsis japonica TaxID=208439 RepID=A0A075V1E0_9PSEU|nr:hypothetical protein [Amycolatopsis japonica]AIG78476.1 Putative membrane protein [Amycolatopsis japonica]